MKKLCVKIFSVIAIVFFAITSSVSAETVVGEGYAPDRAKSPSHAKMLARQAAILDGYSALAAKIKGVHVTGKSTLEDKILEYNIVEAEIDGVVQGAEIRSTKYDGEYPDISCYVTMEIPTYGQNSIASLVFQPHPKEAFLAPIATAKTTGNYTGVILNCSTVKIDVTAMSPSIVSEDHRVVYSYNNIERKTAVNKGIVVYNEKSRAGNNPLIINVNSIDSEGNPIISAKDADALLSENQLTHFLDQCNVVFVTD